MATARNHAPWPSFNPAILVMDPVANAMMVMPMANPMPVMTGGGRFNRGECAGDCDGQC